MLYSWDLLNLLSLRRNEPFSATDVAISAAIAEAVHLGSR